uniref:Holin n=1 Tax=Enterococcus phage vB_EfaS_SZ1 TaxID=3161157 RepID=A0AAU8EIV3_9CAUD
MQNVSSIGTMLMIIACVGIGSVVGTLNTERNAQVKINKMEEEVSLYKGLNERQQDIILKYKQVSGIEVSSITQSLDNEQLIIELEKRINDLEEK